MKRAIIALVFLIFCGCKSEKEEPKSVALPLYKKLELKADSLMVEAANTKNLGAKFVCEKGAYINYKKAMGEAEENATNELKNKYLNAILTRVENIRQEGGGFRGARQEIIVLLKEGKSLIDEGSIDEESVMRYEKLKSMPQE